ncbi:MAG: transglutaminase domain-containing protein [Bacteroidales bacterium]|nr:transglutaminase domain-containing protein [Bacteroidales bacterium]
MIQLSIDKPTIYAGEIVEIKWTCEDADSVRLSINNGYKQIDTYVPLSGSKKIRLNRSKGKTRITLTANKDGETISKNEYVKVKKRWFGEEEQVVVVEQQQQQLPEEPNEEILEDEDIPWWRMCIFFGAVILITIPIFPLIYKLIPDLNWIWGLDRTLEFIVLAVIVGIVLSIRDWFDVAALGIMITILTLGSIKGNGYGFRQLAQDYEIFHNSHKHKDKMIKSKYKYTSTKKKTKSIDTTYNYFKDYRNYDHKKFLTEEKHRIKEAADYKNPIVRNFAVQQATEEPFASIGKYQSSDDIKNIVHAFAVFKAINHNWKYVHDPNGFDYNSKASETIKNRANGKFTGDCDDHAIVMAASVVAVGAKARIVLSYDTRTHKRHAYPELWLGSRNNVETVYYLIGELFPQYNYEREFYYNIDENGDYWLNLDYTKNYPGGYFLQDSVDYVINLP